MLKHALQAAACAGLVLTMAPAMATAAPLSTAPAIGNEASNVSNVHWRSWRHCHWRHGERFCHGGRRHWDNGGPGINLYIGGKRRHHHDRHDRHGDHDRRKHHD